MSKEIKYDRKIIGDGIAYTEIKDERFRTNTVVIGFYEPASYENAPANALIPKILSESSADYPSITALSRHLTSLYGASVRAGNVKRGDYHILTASAGCIADKFTINGENINDDLVDTFIGCLFRPLVIDGAFEKKDFELKKNELLDDIDAEINDKRAYAFRRANQIIYRGEPAEAPVTGRRCDAEKLTSEDVYRRYLSLLKTARIEMIFVGYDISDANREKIFSALRSVERDHFTDFKKVLSPVKPEPEFVSDRLEIVQSKTVMAFKSSYENTAGMQMFLGIFGSTPFSKLFLNVREKMGLCYYCTASYNDKKGVVYVDCGTDAENTEPARREILNQLELMKKGDFTDEDMHNARLSCVNGLRAVNDSPSAISMWYFERLLFDEVITPEEEIENLRAVTRDEIIRAANSLVLDTVYVLTGKEKE